MKKDNEINKTGPENSGGMPAEQNALPSDASRADAPLQAEKGKAADPKKQKTLRLMRLYVTQGIIYLFVFLLVPLMMSGNHTLTVEVIAFLMYTVNVLVSLLLPAAGCARHGFGLIDVLLPVVLYIPFALFVAHSAVYLQFMIYYGLAALAGASIGATIHNRRAGRKGGPGGSRRLK